MQYTSALAGKGNQALNAASAFLRMRAIISEHAVDFELVGLVQRVIPDDRVLLEELGVAVGFEFAEDTGRLFGVLAVEDVKLTAKTLHLYLIITEIDRSFKEFIGTFAQKREGPRSVPPDPSDRGTSPPGLQLLKWAKSIALPFFIVL